jgi:hypothetical protein
MVADFGTLLCVLLALATTGQSAKHAFSDFHLVVLSLTMYAKRRVVVRRVVAMSHCRSVQIEGLAYQPNDRATLRRMTTRRLACFARDRTTRRQRAVWRFVMLSLATRRKDDNDIGFVVAIGRNVPNQPP